MFAEHGLYTFLSKAPVSASSWKHPPNKDRPLGTLTSAGTRLSFPKTTVTAICHRGALGLALSALEDAPGDRYVPMIPHEAACYACTLAIDR